MDSQATPPVTKPATDAALSALRQSQAERFIEQSQDGVAIRTLANLRRQPQSFMQRLKEAATHNQTLRLALGICVGVVAAEAITGLMRGPALHQALARVEGWLNLDSCRAEEIVSSLSASEAPSGLPLPLAMPDSAELAAQTLSAEGIDSITDLADDLLQQLQSATDLALPEDMDIDLD